MLAATMAAFGDIHVLDFGEVPTPSPKPGHVLIKVAAVGAELLRHVGQVRRRQPLDRASTCGRL